MNQSIVSARATCISMTAIKLFDCIITSVNPLNGVFIILHIPISVQRLLEIFFVGYDAIMLYTNNRG